MMIALIDSDIILYRVGFTTEKEEEHIAQYRLQEMVDNILHETAADSYKMYVSDSKNNWRRDLYPDYKANRKAPKPRHLEFLTNLMLDKYNTHVAWGEEADDALGIEQTNYNNSYHSMLLSGKEAGCHQSVICTIDKDLKQIPGKHYNFVKKEWDNVTTGQGRYNFYYQCLVGDPADNIKGCRTIGAVRATRILSELSGELEIFDRVLGVYREFQPGTAEEDLLLAGRLLKIRTSEGLIWNFPTQT